MIFWSRFPAKVEAHAPHAGDAAQSEVFDAGPNWAIERQISPEVQFDQSVNW